jgi:hypothetical protein
MEAAYDTVQQMLGTHHASRGRHKTSMRSTTTWNMLPRVPDRAKKTTRGGR